MEMSGKIRRMYVRDKLSLHEIAKRTGLSRSTISKWVRPAEAVVPIYRRGAAPKKLTDFHVTLERALKADGLRPKHNRRTAKALFAQIKADGYEGGYSRITAFIREWRGKEGKAVHAFVPLKFALGEAFQCDWSEEGLVVGGNYRHMQVSHLKLCASRAFWPVAYSVPCEWVAIQIAHWFNFDDPDLELALLGQSRGSQMMEIFPKLGAQDPPTLNSVEAIEIIRHFNALTPSAKEKIKIATDRLKRALLRLQPADRAVEVCPACLVVTQSNDNFAPSNTHFRQFDLLRSRVAAGHFGDQMA